MNCILVPTHGLDVSLLERLANSIDYPVKNKIVVCNGKEDSLDEWKERHPDWHVVYPEKNLGVAGSWNLAPILFPQDDAWLIINDDHELQPGCLEQICKASDEHHKDYPVLYMNEHEGYDMFVWTRVGLEQFGTFDENFYPLYYEDYDYRVRIALAGLKGYAIGTYETLPIKHGKGRSGGDTYNAMIQATGAINREYYTRKWGAVADKDVPFTNPFDNQNTPSSKWTLEPNRRNDLEAMWNQFMSQDNPSIYT